MSYFGTLRDLFEFGFEVFKMLMRKIGIIIHILGCLGMWLKYMFIFKLAFPKFFPKLMFDVCIKNVTKEKESKPKRIAQHYSWIKHCGHSEKDKDSRHVELYL